MSQHDTRLVQTVRQLSSMTKMATNAAAVQDQHAKLQRISQEIDYFKKELVKVSDLVKFADLNLTPLDGWRDGLGIQNILDFLIKLKEQFSTDNWNYFFTGTELDDDKRDFNNSVLRITNEIDSLWSAKRDKLFSIIDLEFEVPQELLKFLHGSPRIRASFPISMQLLRSERLATINDVWIGADKCLSGLNDYLTDLSTRISDSASEIRPVKDAITALPQAVSLFLTAASKDEATIDQVLDLEVQDWLMQDANLIKFFRIRTHS